MIKAIDNKPLDLTTEEFGYYNEIINAFGVNIFKDTFEVNDDENSKEYGFIKLIKPPMTTNLPIGVIFFLFNVQLNQQIRKIDNFLVSFEQKLEITLQNNLKKEK